MRMRVGIVGGQKRKTEAHLFKSLKDLDIDVAWHVEAMTNREFPRDTDCIVSMFDYVGHGLEKRAHDFADLNGIPFRRISFNWSKSMPVFLELKAKFEAGQPANGDEMGMRKAVSPNKDLLSADDMGKELGVPAHLVRRAGAANKIEEYWRDHFGRRLVFFSKTECCKFFEKTVKNETIVPAETHLETIVDMVNRTITRPVMFPTVPAKTVMVVTAETPMEKIVDMVNGTVTRPAMSQTIPERTVTVIPKETGNVETIDKREMYLCRVRDRVMYPIIGIDSLDDIDSAVSLDMTDGEKEYAVITVIKRLKAEFKVTITEINEPM